MTDRNRSAYLTDVGKNPEAGKPLGVLGTEHDEPPPTPRKVDELDQAAEALLDAQLDRFKALVDRDVEHRLTDDAVARRFRQDGQAVREWFDDPDGDADELAEFALQAVTLWLHVLRQLRPFAVGLDGGDIDEVAIETVALALGRFGEKSVAADDAQRKVGFLTTCSHRLADAYLNWRMRAAGQDSLDIEAVDEYAAEADDLVKRLRNCVDTRLPEAVDHLSSLGLPVEDIDHIMSVTREALWLPRGTAD